MTISPGCTFQRIAAAATSLARASAPACLSCIQLFAIAVDPPVPCAPNSVLAYFVTSAGACSTRICSRLASSSSAMMVAKPVNGPWPNSICLQRIVTVLSGAMRMKAFGANPLAASAASA